MRVAHEFPGIGRTAIVSDCDDVLKYVQNIGAFAIRQHEAGMNAAISEGAQVLRSLTDDLIVLPSDLPKLEASDIRQFCAVDRSHRIALCADRWERGTNGILLRDVATFEFAFGENSFALHWRRATHAGANPYRFCNPNMAFDIDVPADLGIWIGQNQMPKSPPNPAGYIYSKRPAKG
jgi:2-phospho-L-lactate guanylyltransferase